MLALLASALTAAEPSAHPRLGSFAVDFSRAPDGPCGNCSATATLLDHRFIAGCVMGASPPAPRTLNTLVVDLDAHDADAERLVSEAEQWGYRVVLRPQKRGFHEQSARRNYARFAGKAWAWDLVPFVLDADTRPGEAARLWAALQEIDPGAQVFISARTLGSEERAEALLGYLDAYEAAGGKLDALILEPAPAMLYGEPETVLGWLDALDDESRPFILGGAPSAQDSGWHQPFYDDPRIAGILCGAGSRSLTDFLMSVTPPPIDITTDANGRGVFSGPWGDYALELEGHRFFTRFAPGLPLERSLKDPEQAAVPGQWLHPFVASNSEDAAAWQAKVRSYLLEIVEAQVAKKDVPLAPSFGSFEEVSGYSKRPIVFKGNDGESLEAFLTVPKGDPPFPAVVCLHGHGGNKEMMHDPESQYGGIAAHFAERGFVTIAPTLEHREHASNHLWNLMRLVDLLESLDAVDPERIGCAGLSMGAEWTMWLTATDLRIKAAVVSGWMCTTAGVLSVHNCACWMTPGLLECCDIADVHGLIAPRPLLFESAISDKCFPIPAADEGYRRALAIYRALGAGANVRRHVFPGGHAWNGGVAYGFMARALAR